MLVLIVLELHVNYLDERNLDGRREEFGIVGDDSLAFQGLLVGLVFIHFHRLYQQQSAAR